MNTDTEKALWRDAFKQSNAITALEGGELSELGANLQEQVIEGVISVDEAIASLKRAALESNANA